MPLALPSLACFASAVAWFVRFDAAVSESRRSTVTGFGASTSAVVFETTTLTAIEPATPTLLPPAPEVACAAKLDAAGCDAPRR